MKQSLLRTSCFALGALFAGACASAVDGGEDMDFESGDLPYEDGSGLVDTDDGDVVGESGEAYTTDDMGEADAMTSEEVLASKGELGTLEQGLGGDCGSQSSTSSRIIKAIAVPDHFPPDSPVAQVAALAIGVPLAATLGCAAFGIANMDPTCDVHDACYGEFGATQSGCDNEAKAGWERACKNTYDEFTVGNALVGLIPVLGVALTAAEAAEQACRTACLGQAELMFQAVSRGGRSAFEEAQRGAAPPPTQTGPIFF